MQHPIYMHPINATPEQRSQFVQDMYPGVSYTAKEVVALDEVSQLYHRLGSTHDAPQPMVKLSEAGVLALNREWLVSTSVGYEPTVKGLLAVDDLRVQVGYSRRFEPWGEEMKRETASRAYCIPEASIPTYYVLNWLQKWERQRTTNATVILDGYYYVLLHKNDFFERLPVNRFPEQLVNELIQRKLVVECSGGLYLTIVGEALSFEFEDAISEEHRAEEQHEASLAEIKAQNESTAGHATVCATGPAHEPEHTNGTEDGFTTCLGCGNDLWVGYIEDEHPTSVKKK